MKKTMTTTDIANALHSDEYGGWSYAGAYALAEWLEEMEEGTGEEMEFDRVAIRCDFSEYASLADWADDYFMNWAEEFGINYDNPMTGKTEIQSTTDEDGNIHDEVLNAIKAHIQDHGWLIEFDGGIIVSSF